ncbi:hypothetical protein L1987_37892 [Smallanthus sonchifolius]|uniref:Uncharacterized protein n=1 Tax=Smallanthus sonchifolius TaxID=185202 RepID=A0ACB9HIU9_9ASTR|nr:hypothetical protein L1987_37892 [Smallanthus sonchifolius]
MAVAGWWGDRRSAFTVFSSLLLVHCVAILLFTSGFLLTRTELPHYSHCSDAFQSPCGLPDHQSPPQNANCWTKPAVDRIVIIVLDALRFDFVAPSTFFQEKKPWMDKLKVLHKLASESESAARIFKAIADPPTTSLQRLKGLTTGGLPTFIDIGNSFGAPAIVEDNLIHQLVQNGKRVVMMGDTWTQLFPHHFNKSYPYPSFNVKDLDTVDNGCISHLIPTLYDDDWDVLIAHFLGVDHAGHIFGVDSVQMIDKLQQYNEQLEKVVDALQSQSGKGGLHENTLLLVMGDHGQTVNGDHGGGSPEEVDTSIFAMSLKRPSFPVPSEFDTSSCKLDLDGRKVCISSVEQLDFAATVSALLGIPFPFGSIGRVNPMLYGLVAGTWNLESYDMSSSHSQLKMEEWMHNYAKVLCTNCWQVKKYIDVHTDSSVIGFSIDDLKHIEEIYSQAVNWSTDSLHDDISSFDALKKQIDLYSSFLAHVAELARTKFTEFDLRMMGIGFGILLTSIFIHLLVIKWVDDMYIADFHSHDINTVSFGLVVSCTIVAARACSFLSNSYILEEGKRTSFILASIAMLGLRHSIMKKKMINEAAALALLIFILRFTIELGLSKQGSPEISEFHSWVYVADLLPILPLIILAYLLYKSISSSSCNWLLKFVITGSIFSYILVALHLTLGSSSLSHMTPPIFDGIKGNFIPRAIYIMGIAQLLSLAVLQFFEDHKTSNWEETTLMKAVAMLSVWSSTLIILSGKQGPWVALASVIGGWLISRLKGLDPDYKNGSTGLLARYSSPVTQWSLLASCLFFCTGHWCAFNGLRYAAAFIGFDEFTIIPQAILLTIETYGFSHILPTLGLPFLVAYRHSSNKTKQTRESLNQLFQAYLIYGLIMAVTTSFTVLCVMIQRRHLMVWGLFAPKFVFDVVGLLLTDVLICVSSLIYFVRT